MMTRGGGPLHLACPGIAGCGSAIRRHELNHGDKTAQILAWLPRLWVLQGHQEEVVQRRAPGQRPCRRREVGLAALDREKSRADGKPSGGGGGGWGSRRDAGCVFWEMQDVCALCVS
jgi:hypothetical protein